MWLIKPGKLNFLRGRQSVSISDNMGPTQQLSSESDSHGGGGGRTENSLLTWLLGVGAVSERCLRGFRKQVPDGTFLIRIQVCV